MQEVAMAAAEHEIQAEAEVKIRLGADEFAALPAVLVRLGFTPAGACALTDYYLTYARAVDGGWDYTRLRVSDVGYRLTHKWWRADATGQSVRLEDERALSAAEGDALLSTTPAARMLRKRRQDFRGRIGPWDATVSLDALELAGGVQYFLECEVMTAPEDASGARAELASWLCDTLPVRDTTEAPTMLDLLLTAE